MKKRIFNLSMILIVLLGLLSACATQATTPASCGFVVGSGINGYDAKFKRIIYPNQKSDVDPASEKVLYFPCNSRNYIINNGTLVNNITGAKIGDRSTLISAYTATGVPILIGATADWTVNQKPSAIEHFYEICLKYKCATSEDKSGDANFSTEGWNGMLAENFGPAMDIVGQYAAMNIDDSIWVNHSRKKYDELGDAMSAAFAGVMRRNFGYDDDIFCGSGNSAWPDKNKPGTGEFFCSPVRITVTSVERGTVKADDATLGGGTINEQRLANARKLYGDRAEFWLGLQDTIDKCRAAGTMCVVNISDGSSTGVAVPLPAPTAIPPAPEPTKKP